MDWEYKENHYIAQPESYFYHFSQLNCHGNGIKPHFVTSKIQGKKRCSRVKNMMAASASFILGMGRLSSTLRILCVLTVAVRLDFRCDNGKYKTKFLENPGTFDKNNSLTLKPACLQPFATRGPTCLYTFLLGFKPLYFVRLRFVTQTIFNHSTFLIQHGLLWARDSIMINNQDH